MGFGRVLEKIGAQVLLGLTREEAEAAFAAVVAVAVGDGELSDAEASQLEHELRFFPGSFERPANELRNVVRSSAAQVMSLEDDPDAAVELVRGIAERIPGKQAREAVYRLCAAVGFADASINAGERNVLGGLRQAFGIDEERSQELLEETRRTLAHGD